MSKQNAGNSARTMQRKVKTMFNFNYFLFRVRFFPLRTAIAQ